MDRTFNQSADWAVSEGIGFQRNLRPQESAVVVSREGRHLGDDLSDVFYEKGVQYVNTHDFTLGLPETFFGGAVLRIKAPEKGAGRTLFSVELEAPQDAEEQQAEERSAAAAGRFFLKKVFGE